MVFSKIKQQQHQQDLLLCLQKKLDIKGRLSPQGFVYHRACKTYFVLEKS
jgi:hypothetical protein